MWQDFWEDVNIKFPAFFFYLSLLFRDYNELLDFKQVLYKNEGCK